MTIPNLAGVISKDDVFRKGTGNYAADYVSWARIANHLHTTANGWEFHLKPAPDGGHVWQAPDGTGYLVSYFTGPDDQATPDFVFPCQDNRNQPIKLDKISCRTLTDTHRRALCANAAFTFGLGYELWAKEEVAAASDEPAAPAVQQQVKPAEAKPKAAPAKPKASAKPAEELSVAALPPEEQPITEEERILCRTSLAELNTAPRNQIITAFKKQFNLPADALITSFITLPEHVRFISEQVAQQPPEAFAGAKAAG